MGAYPKNPLQLIKQVRCLRAAIVYLCFGLGLGLQAPAASASDPSTAELFSQGIAERDAGDFPAAEATFRRILARDAENTDAGLILGLVLGYQDRFDEGLAVLNQAIRIDPKRDDLKIARARLLAWSERRSEAGALIADVLSRDPDNSEAKALKDWMARGGTPMAQPFTASMSIARSHFERRALARWYEYRLGLGYQFTPQVGAGTTLHQSRRHGLIDHNLSLNGVYRAGSNTVISLGAEATTAADFLPQWGGSMRVDQRLWDGQKSGWIGPTSFALSARHRHYKSVQVNNLDPELTQYLIDGRLWLTLGNNSVWDNSVDGKLNGWHLRLDVDLQSTLPSRVYVLRANAPETDQGVTVETDTLAAGFLVDVTDRLGLRLDYTRDDRSGSYLRHQVSLSAAIRF